MKIAIYNLLESRELDAKSLANIRGGIWKKNSVIPGYVAPTVLYDDAINVQTTDPSTSNVS
jgi:hypothetical protein